MTSVQQALGLASPRPEAFQEEAARQLEEAYRLRGEANDSLRAGIRAVKKKNARGVEHAKARAEQNVERIRELRLLPSYLRAEFSEQVNAELVELVAFEWAYPYVFFNESLASGDFLGAERLGISHQACFHGLADVPGELGKAITDFRLGEISGDEEIAVIRRFLEVALGFIYHLAGARKEEVLAITGHEKMFRGQFEGKIFAIGGLIRDMKRELAGILAARRH